MKTRARMGAAVMVITVAGVLAVCGGGCGSLDSRKDVERAAELVRERTGHLPEWLTEARDEPMPERLGEQSAVRMALARDATLLRELQRIAEARADLVQSGLLPNPVLAFDLGFPFDGSGGPTRIGVGLTQQLTAILTRKDRMNAADAELRERVLECSDRALRTVAQTRQAFARVVYAQRALEPTRQAVADAERAVEQARKRVAAGEDTSLEVNRQRLLHLKMTTELVERESSLEQRRRELLVRLGRAEHVGAWSVEDGNAGEGIDATEEQVIELARTRRLDVAAAAAASDAATALVRSERKGRLELSAGAGFERTDDGRREIGPSVEVGLPVFDWGDARVAKREAEARRLMLERTRVEQEAIAEARNALVAERAARTLAARYETEVGGLATSNLDLARRSFAAGQADLTVLLEAQQVVAESRLRAVDLRERAVLARIELERAVGGKLRE